MVASSQMEKKSPRSKTNLKMHSLNMFNINNIKESSLLDLKTPFTTAKEGSHIDTSIKNRAFKKFKRRNPETYQTYTTIKGSTNRSPTNRTNFHRKAMSIDTNLVNLKMQI